MVRIKCYGRIKDILGAELLDMEAQEQLSLESLISKITGMEKFLLQEFSIILVNGRNCMFLGGLKSPINDGDLVEILPLVKGG